MFEHPLREFSLCQHSSSSSLWDTGLDIAIKIHHSVTPLILKEKLSPFSAPSSHHGCCQQGDVGKFG